MAAKLVSIVYTIAKIFNLKDSKKYGGVQLHVCMYATVFLESVHDIAGFSS